MATFQPNIQEQGAVTGTRDSLGPRNPTALKEAFEGIGNAVTSVAEAVDYANIDAIQQEVANQSLFEANQNDATPLVGTPSEVSSAASDFERLNQSVLQGLRSQADASLRASTLSKRLRAKYPGYSREIDKALKNSGFSSGNDVFKDRLALMKEYRRQAEDARNEDLKVNESLSKLGVANPQSLPQDQKLAFLYQKNAEVAKETRDAQQLDLLAKQNKATDDHYERVAREAAVNRVYSFFDTARFNGENADKTNPLNKLVTSIDAARNGNSEMGDKISPQESAELQAMLRQAKSAAIADFQTNILGHNINGQRLGAKLNIDAQKKIQEQVLAIFDQYEGAIASNDVEKLAMLETQNKLRREQTLSAIFEVSPTMALVDGVRQIGGPDMAGQLWQSLGGFEGTQEEVDKLKTIIPVIRGNMLTQPNYEFGEALQAGRISNQSASMIKGIIKSHAQLLGSSSLDNNSARILSEKTFTSSSLQEFMRYSSEDQTAILKALTSPQITDNIKKADSIRGYKAWVDQAFVNIYSPKITALQKAMVSSYGIDITYNPETSQFEVSGLGAGPSTLTPLTMGNAFAFPDTFKNDQNIRAIKEINEFIARYKPILKASGVNNVDEAILQVMQSAAPGFDPSTIDNDQTLLGSFFRGLLSAISPVSEAKASETQEGTVSNLPEGYKGIRDAIAVGEGTKGLRGYQTMLGNYQDRAGIDITSMTVDELLDLSSSGSDYANYSRQAVGRMATPMGKYQIVGTTLRGLKEKMGLNGDEVFTPELQDEMFIELMKDKGLEAYLSGQLDKQTFFRRLQGTWEGLKKNKKSASQTFEALDNI